MPGFIRDATNVYRTKEFIVKQIIGIEYDCREGNEIFSRDTYYKRTPARDHEYECLFSDRRNIDGKRLPSTAYNRRYVK